MPARTRGKHHQLDNHTSNTSKQLEREQSLTPVLQGYMIHFKSKKTTCDTLQESTEEKEALEDKNILKMSNTV